MEVGDRGYKEQVCRATVLRTEYPTPRLSLPPLGQTGVGQKRMARRDADCQAGQGAQWPDRRCRARRERVCCWPRTREPLPTRCLHVGELGSSHKAGTSRAHPTQAGRARLPTRHLRDWRAGFPGGPAERQPRCNARDSGSTCCGAAKPAHRGEDAPGRDGEPTQPNI